MTGRVSLSLLLAALLVSCLPSCRSVYESPAQYARTQAAASAAMSARLDAQPVCCATYADVDYAKVADRSLKIVLDERSPVFAFPNGKSRFYALEMPPLVAGDQIQMVQVDRVHRLHLPMIKPMLILLSQQYEVLETFAPAEFDQGYIGWDDSGKKATLVLDEKTARARYVVLAANPAWVGKAFGVKANAGPFALYVDYPDFGIPYSYEGSAHLYFKKK